MEQKPLTFSEFLEKIKPIIPVWLKANAPLLSAKLKKFLLEKTTKYLGANATKFIGVQLLKLIGMSGSFYAYVIYRYSKKLWDYLYPKLKSFFYTVDRKAIDDKNLKELEKNETNGATSDEKIQDELDFLNGTKPNP